MKREDSVKDIGALLDWIAQQPDLDASRVVVTGGSYGGYMSLACATHYNDRIARRIDVVGISNFVTFLESTESYRRDLRRAEYGDERDPKMREFLRVDLAAQQRATRSRKPLFVVQGENDPRVPYTEAEQIVATLQAATARRSGSSWRRTKGTASRRSRTRTYQFYATAGSCAIPAQMMIIVSSVQTQVAINCAPLANRVGVERPKVLVYRLEVEMI